MGGAAPAETKGGKRSMDAVINLVPYIDLLMTIMTFLVMTAVWTQLAVIDVQNSSGGPQDEPEDKEDDPPPPIFILLEGGPTIDSVTLLAHQEGDEPVKHIGAAGPDYDALTEQLKGYKEARPERVVVNVKAGSKVPFQVIAKAVDIATGEKLTGITLQPGN